MRARHVHRLNAALIFLFALVSAAVWPELPGRVPIHFGRGGEPDLWVRTSLLSWFLLPVLAAGLALFLRAVASFAARVPESWSVPQKDLFLGLTPEARRPIVETLEAFVAWVAVLVTLIFAAAQLGVYSTAVGRTVGLAWSVEAFIFADIAAMLVGAVLMSRRVKRRILEAAGR